MFMIIASAESCTLYYFKHHPVHPVLCVAGVDPEYDQAISDIQTTEKELNDYLDKQKKVLSCKVRVVLRQHPVLSQFFL